METKKLNKKQIENICKKAFGIEAKKFVISLHRELIKKNKRFIKGNYKLRIIPELPETGLPIIGIAKYKPKSWDTYNKTINGDKKYNAKVAFIRNIIKHYDINEKTLFSLVVKFDNNKIKVIKTGNYRDCANSYNIVLVNDIEKNYNGKFQIGIIDDKQKYEFLLYIKD